MWGREKGSGNIVSTSLAAPDPKKGSGESQYKKFDCCRNVGGTNEIMPRLIRDVTTYLMCALNDISNTRADCNQDDGETTHYVERPFFEYR